MPKMICQKEIQRILEIINHVLKLIPNLAARIINQKTLLCKAAIWRRASAYDKDLNYMKNTLSTVPILQFYNPSARSKESTDATMQAIWNRSVTKKLSRLIEQC